MARAAGLPRDRELISESLVGPGQAPATCSERRPLRLLSLQSSPCSAPLPAGASGRRGTHVTCTKPISAHRTNTVMRDTCYVNGRHHRPMPSCALSPVIVRPLSYPAMERAPRASSVTTLTINPSSMARVHRSSRPPSPEQWL